MKKFLLFSIAVLLSFPAIAQNSSCSANARLKGRNLVGSGVMPAINTNTEGIVVVKIKVDQYGTVTEATPGVEGTTTTDKNLWLTARNAAMKARFNESTDAPAVQTGTITFTFRIVDGNSIASPFPTSKAEYTPIKELIDAQRNGTYSIRAKYVKTHSYNELVFLVEEDDYIIPIRLVKKDLGAEKRFRALNLQEGDSLIIKGNLSRINVGIDYYTGLEDAVILDVTTSPKPQTVDVDSNSDAVPFQLVEVKPSFNGGDANEFSKWVNSHLKYPESAKENGIQGRVTVQFTIKSDGQLTNVRVLYGVDEALDKEAVRVVSKSPKWKPGSSKGKPVDVIYTFPVIFQLR